MFLGKDIVNPTNAEINRAAEMLIDNPEYALSQGFANNFSTINDYTLKVTKSFTSYKFL